MANVGGLLLLVYYMYAILGVQLFSEIKLGDNLNDDVNFKNFWRAFLTLIRMSTGEAWDTILSDMIAKRTIINQCDYTFDR